GPHMMKSPDSKNDEINKDEIHNIQCHFPNCNRAIAWKRKYGKLRLIDHALVHCDKNFLKCKKCKHTCHTIRQMRYHYRIFHSTSKMEGFGVSGLPTKNKGFQKIMNACFADQLVEMNKRKNPPKSQNGSRRSRVKSKSKRSGI
uniref:C2H2-type domain-containing protein n=1 Tax=Caenorhabditis elegans TaxID=6239 RepID=UPI00389B3AB1